MRLMTAFAASLLLGSALTPAQAEGKRQISGSATYLARIALPADAQLLVEARGSDGASLASAVIATDGKQVPIPFALDVPVSTPASFSLAIQFGGGARWLLEPVKIEPDDKPLELGAQVLHPFAGIGLNAAYLCGTQRIALRQAGDQLLIDAGYPSYPRHVELTSDGAGKYLSADGEISAALSAEGIALTQGGGAWPDCTLVPPIEVATWSAAGAAGDWTAELSAGQLTVQRGDKHPVTVPLSEPAITSRWLAYPVEGTGDVPMVLTVSDEICRGASDQLYPQQVSLQAGDWHSDGCGGAPDALLTGIEWKVTAIRGGDVATGTTPTITFAGAEGVFGTTGCNRYFGGYSADAAGLSFQGVASSMMACPEPLMAQERDFYAALDEVTEFGFADDGSLILRSGETELFRARR